MARGRTVAIRITADTKGLAAGVFRAEVNLKNLTKTAVAATAVMTKFAAAGAGAATGALAALYARTAPLIDAQAKVADRLGLTTQALGGLHLAAKLSGASTETLDMALQRMTRRVSEAARGTGEAVNALKELGLDAREMARQSPDEQFKRIADAMTNVSNQGDRVRLAMKLFDSEGVKLVNTLSMQRDGLDDVADKARRYGTALSRIDAAKVEAANDAWTEAQEASRGLANRITVKLAPVVEALLEQFSQLAEETLGFGDSVDKGFKMAVKAAGFFADVMQGMRVIVKGIELAIAGLMTVAVKSWNMIISSLAKAIDFGLDKVNSFTASLNKVFGTDIPSITFSAQDTGFVQAFDDMAELAGIRVQEIALELQNLAMQEMPSDKIEEWVSKVQEASQKAAEAVAQSRANMFGTPEQQEEQQKLMEEEFEKFREGLLSKEAAEIESLARRHAELRKFHQKGLVSTGDYWTKTAQMTTGMLAGMTATVANHSKRAFDINKKLGIANALMNTYEMATSAYKALAGIPYIGPALGAAAAAAAISFGKMQVDGIRSAQFGGGVAPSASNTPAPPVTPVGGAAPVESGGGTVGGTLLVEGIDPDQLFSGSQMRSLAERLIQHQKDGGSVVFA